MGAPKRPAPKPSNTPATNRSVVDWAKYKIVHAVIGGMAARYMERLRPICSVIHPDIKLPNGSVKKIRLPVITFTKIKTHL